ncbi:MAG: replication-associated recombination protein A [Bacteroidota bacterium]
MQKIPLAERMRPQKLADLIGQEHLTGEGSVLARSVGSGQLPSMILWGPPGVGKTTLAQIVANETGLPFFQLSAISSGVKEIREVIAKAETVSGAILFIDEIHRFNKSQQDALLGAVEKGIVKLIGATTENPSFEVNSALLSRCNVFVLRTLSEEDLLKIAAKALAEDTYLKNKKVELKETAAILRLSGGDARKLLNTLDLVAEFANVDEVMITDALVLQVVQQKMALYDKSGEQHYDIISAFIKSIRGSDPNAALYWMARMLEGGEDVTFIARRMLILASEDIGNANPNALLMANTTFDAVSKIGMPEARIILSQCAIYLAVSPKSNSGYVAIDEAIAKVRATGDLPVPLHLRNAPTHLMKQMNYGKGYAYAHMFEDNFALQEYMPDALCGTKFYEPGHNSREQEHQSFLKKRWKDKYGY